MEESQSSWDDDEDSLISCNGHTSEINAADAEIITVSDDNDENGGASINSILPDEVLERILGHIPFAAIMKARCVCKMWNEIVNSESFIHNYSTVASREPWYFMFTCEFYPYGHVYDLTQQKWYRFDIPYVETPSWNLVSSSGLLCMMDNDSRRKLYVCNPITRYYRKLEEPYATTSDYCALSISLNKSSQIYTVAIVRSKQTPPEAVDWDLSINIYSSESGTWTCPVDVIIEAWRSGTDSVICDGVLYFAVFLTRSLGFIRPRFGIVAYDLASQTFDTDVDEHVIVAPYGVTCMRLINVEGQLVIVGGIQKKGRPGVLRGIGIWILRGKHWEEISRMPNNFFQGFGEFDDVFGSSGFGKLIYIQSYGSPALLMFDMDSKEWSWAYKCPAEKKSPLQLYSGICFEPRLDIVP